jgi:radical SAM superfamily enzyme YgiQ (UPF0313 family)
MKILLVYPEYPQTYWSFHHALKFISKKASFPPLGLMTVAALLPEKWDKKLVDMNVIPLKDDDILWADFVFISAMVVQKESAQEVVGRCRMLGVRTVAGGPLFTCGYEGFETVDHFLLNEAEITIPEFLRDIENGCVKRVYQTEEWADIRKTPIPLWSLVDIKKYATMNIQYSRGCPFNCDFCNITTLYGRIPRTKEAAQMLEELDSLFNAGWRGAVFFVDDNFIGNKVKLKKEILPAITGWMEKKGYPFTFFTEASVDIADDDELMSLMVKAGFNSVFVGIESPNEASLAECSKYQNRNRDLMEVVKKLHRSGLQVQGGFIVGFDSDPASIFEKLISFIQESGIVTAMVGLLNAPRGTRLYQRMLREGRLLSDMSGNNTDLTMNFIPKMSYDFLLEGYKRIVNTIYSPKYYYERVVNFLKDFRPLNKSIVRVQLCDILAFIKAMFILGIVGKERVYYWKLIFWSLVKKRELFSMAVTFSIYGFHFRKVFEEY